MNQISGKDVFRQQVFGDDSRRQFDACYPEQAAVLDHNMLSHELLTLDALAKLGTALPAKSVEYNPGDLPVGIRPEDVPDNGMTIGDTIRTIDQSASWAVLKNIEQMDCWRKSVRSWRPRPGRCSSRKALSSYPRPMQ